MVVMIVMTAVIMMVMVIGYGDVDLSLWQPRAGAEANLSVAIEKAERGRWK